MFLFPMVAQARQHRAVAVQGVDVIDQAFAEVEHLHQVAIAHRCIELLLQFPGDHLDYLEVAQVVMDVVEQQVQQHIQRRAQWPARTQPGKLAVVGGDHQELVPGKQQAAGRHFKHQVAAARIVLRALPDQEQVIGVELDARHFVRVQRRGQGVFIELVAVAQVLALVGVRIAEQQDIPAIAQGVVKLALG